MLLDRIEKWYERIGKKILYLLIGIFFIYIFLKYILELIAPFVIAWILAALLNPFVTWLKKRFSIPRGIGTLLSMLTVLSAFLGVVFVLVKQLWYQIIAFSNAFPLYKSQIVGVLDTMQEKLVVLTEMLPLPDAFTSLDSIVTELLNSVGSFFEKIVPYAYGVVSQVPNGVIFIIIMLIATFFMTKDHKEIKNFVKAQIPSKILEKVGIMQQGLKNALGGYIKTQLILMCFTFTVCLVGLCVLRRDYALLISFAIAIFDALPVFGSGAILIPWGIYNLLIGNFAVGIGLLSIYGLIVVIRQVMEPKVLSTQIGVYALVTLMAMYIGLKLIGVFGFILGPVVVVMVQTLQKVGVIPPFKPVKDKKNE